MNSRHLLAISAAVVALIVLSLPAGAAKTKPGRLVKDYRYGYAIKAPRDWSRMPPSPIETTAVAHWVGPRRKEAAPSLTMLYFDRRLRTPDSPGTEGVERIPDELVRVPGKDEPASVKEWLDDLVIESGGLSRIDESKPARIGKLKGRLYLATLRTRGIERLLLVSARDGDREYGMAFRCAMSEYESFHKAGFGRCLDSFVVLKIRDESEVDYDEAFEAEKAGDRSEEQQKRWLAKFKERVSETGTWGSLSTPHYLIIHDRGVRLKQVRRIAVHIEAIRRDVFEKVFPTNEPIRAISVVRICKDQDQYCAYGGHPGSVGYWSSKNRELVFFSRYADAIRVLYHEAFHQYIFHAFGKLAPHTWFNEGNAEYFAGFNYTGRFEPDRLQGRLQRFRADVSQKSTVPLGEFINYSQREYYSDADRCYSQGWALVYFLRHSRDPACRKILPTYFEELRNRMAELRKNQGPEGGIDPRNLLQAIEGAQQKAFAGIDLAALEQRLLKFF